MLPRIRQSVPLSVCKDRLFRFSVSGFIAFKVITFFKRCIYGDDDEEDDAYILHRLFKDDYQMRDRNAASQFRNEQAGIQEGVRTEPAPRPGATNAVATEDSPYSRRHQRPSGEDDDFSYDDFLYDYDDFPYDD